MRDEEALRGQVTLEGATLGGRFSGGFFGRIIRK